MKRLNVSRNMLYTWGGCGVEGRERRRVWRRVWGSANVGLMGQMCGREKGRVEDGRSVGVKKGGVVTFA